MLLRIYKSAKFIITLKIYVMEIYAIKPGPKPNKARRRRDNKDTPKNNPALKPSKKK